MSFDNKFEIMRKRELEEVEFRCVTAKKIHDLKVENEALRKSHAELPRKEVMDFAKIMEQKLKSNDHKGGWNDMSVKQLFTLLTKEVNELTEEIIIKEDDIHAIIDECVDVANFAMMIADNLKSEAEKVGR